jgi:hypothetical protein
MHWVLKNRLTLIGGLLGGIAGYCYYHFIGCTNGTCLISSKPLNSIIYFGVMGGLLFSIVRPKKDDSKESS